MKSSNLSELTTEALVKQKKLLSGILAAFIVVMFIAYSLLIYLMFRNNDFKLAVIIPLGFVWFLPIIIRLAQINGELKTRGWPKPH